jgi:hypothetical protein
MAVDYIFRKVGQKIGLVPARADDRIIIADYVNQAALEIYEEMLDIPDLLKEVSVEVSSEETVALPNDVAYIRAIRESNSDYRVYQWSLRDTYQKYQDGVQDQTLWTSFNEVGYKPVTQAIESGVVTLTIPTLDGTIVTLVGATSGASRHVEQLTMDGITKVSTASFTRLDEIFKDGTNNYDITVKDSGNNTVAVIPNHQIESKYLIVDVSKYPYVNSEAVSMDILYKIKLPNLQADTDTFPAWGYDDTIVDKAVQIWAEDNNDPEKAILSDKRLTRALRRKEANRAKGMAHSAQFTFNIPDVNGRHKEPANWRRLRRG